MSKGVANPRVIIGIDDGGGLESVPAKTTRSVALVRPASSPATRRNQR